MDEDAPAQEASRASIRPSRPSTPPRSRAYRVVVAALWIGIQLGLVLTAGRRVDGAFGFRMFPESSTVKVALFREIDGPRGRMLVHVEGGVWNARGADGVIHRMTWYDRVPRPFWRFDDEMHASYGARTQLARLQGALDDVATHSPNDVETRRLLLEVTVRKNGREPVMHPLASQERF